MAAVDLVNNNAKDEVVSEKTAAESSAKKKRIRNSKGKEPKPQQEIDPNTVSKLDVNNTAFAVQALYKVLEATKSDKLSLVEENTPIQLQYSFKRIPQMKNKPLHIQVPHSTVTENTDICLFVKDVHKGAEDQEDKRDFQPSVRHFRNIVETAGVHKVEEIIPVIQLKREFRDFEAKKKLSDSYDLFLCDDRVSKFMPKLLGKSFVNKRKLPINVKLHDQERASKTLKRALSSIHGFISGKGSSSSLTVGHTGLKPQQIAENVDAAVKQLINVIPGGWSNLRNLHVTTTKSTSIPLYVSTESANPVQLPPDVKKERKMIASGDPGLIGDEDGVGDVEVFDDGTVKFDGHEEMDEEEKDSRPQAGKKKTPKQEKKPKTTNGDTADAGKDKPSSESQKNKNKKKQKNKNGAKKDSAAKNSASEQKSPAKSADGKEAPAKKAKIASTKGPLSKKPRLA